MLKKTMWSFAVAAVLGLPVMASAEVEGYDPAIDGPFSYVDEPAYSDNTGALGTGDNAADISSETGGVVGTAEGEITIFHDSSGIKVFSGLNKVEVIPTGSDGWVGSYEEAAGEILFHPAGRPQLSCPSQSGAAGWFGPCKLVETQS